MQKSPLLFALCHVQSFRNKVRQLRTVVLTNPATWGSMLCEHHLQIFNNFYLEAPNFRTSLVAQIVKNLPAMQETRVLSLGGEDPLEQEMATHFSILAWRIPRTDEPGAL